MRPHFFRKIGETGEVTIFGGLRIRPEIKFFRKFGLIEKVSKIKNGRVDLKLVELQDLLSVCYRQKLEMNPEYI